ncbi:MULTISPECIES: glutaredoxin [unclassified Oceanispirochaeta]|uniref:glutaredoxin family protein n=1 Tax=unclassified Oceanispirochaeta TaxID=2635722 RepID=UPI000E093388|nr:MULTISPECIES: glutaredoxin [unclassified Oceanispirochaeta]MBF9015498.1 glutaredoxin [Oceanispirochaeta sp. M2]NPD71957.1 glutaredoxin [Oceanispirochaeta sp. M1]RDG32764.1 glutaredoxin [Oceanispirochaeta sp. M1]
MFDNVDFSKSEGSRTDHKLTLLGLTTCSFCKKGKQFLDDNDFSYDYLFLDKIDTELKKKMKIEFTEKYDKRLSYPTLIIDDKEILTGFIRIAWEKELMEQE